jgi:SSS family solute:Na+ symporter
VALVGIIVRRRATKKLDSYYLGDRNVPWWMLGLSGCSSYIDIGGTMSMIGVVFYLGLKSLWATHIFWGWFIICFYMAFQAKWIRRSGVMTFAEWNETRFGSGREAEGARLASAIFLLVLMVCNLMFISVGTGKFAEEFLPLPRWEATLIVLAVVGVYVTLGGFFGVILTDILQTVLITVGAVILAVLVFQHPPAAKLIVKDPGWYSLAPTWKLWPSFLSQTAPAYQHFYLFGPILIAGFSWMVFRVLAGPNVWDFQFFLTTRSARDASLAGGMWTIGYTLRWVIGCAFMVLGVVYLGSQAGFDAEKIMPLVLQRFPSGMRGFFMAILLAALMSTISAMINVTSSVVINDFIKRYFARNLTQKKLVRLGQLASVAAVLAGFFFSLSFSNVVTAWETMVFVVVTIILVPATLRWFYWRFRHGPLLRDDPDRRPPDRSDGDGHPGRVLQPGPALRLLGPDPARSGPAGTGSRPRPHAPDGRPERPSDHGLPIRVGPPSVLPVPEELEASRNLGRSRALPGRHPLFHLVPHPAGQG